MAAAAVSGSDSVSNTSRIRLPDNFFAHIGPGKARNSLYQCLKCPTGLLRSRCLASIHLVSFK